MNNQNTLIPPAELMSALVDGELDPGDCKNALSLNAERGDIAWQWRAYHLIGDVLRAGSQQSLLAGHGADRGADALFVDRLNQRLALEKIGPAVVSAVVSGAAQLPPLQTALQVNRSDKQAANDGNMRWKMLAGVACMGTVAMLVFSVSGLNSNGAASSQLAQVGQGQVVVTSAQGPVVRDARLEEMLAAHKQMVGTSLPVPTGFLRNANFENPAGAPR